MDVARTPPKRSRWRLPLLVGLAIVAIAAITFALGNIRKAAPSVERDSVWLDRVTRGPMVRAVQGAGTLVPEEIRWLSARTAARVEEIRVRPGARVEADAVLMVLSNPELEMQWLEARRQVAAVEAELANLAASRSSERLAQQSAVAALQSELADARGRAAADEALAKKGFLSRLELEQSLGRASSLESRLEFERRRLSSQTRAQGPELEAVRAQAQRLREIAEFRQREVEALQVRAGIDGVVQEVPLQVGQAVGQGELLAKVVRPDRLKAEVRVAETQAKDLAPGQLARVDTRNGIAAGKVSRVDPAAQGGTVRVDITFEEKLPEGARPDLGVEATIELERLASVLQVGRPVGAAAATGATPLFKLVGDGSEAVRVPVRFGRASVKSIEVLSGLAEGDQVILSDTSRWDAVDRIRLR